MLVEGLHLVEESLVDGVRYDVVLVSSRLEATEEGAMLREHLLRSGNPLIEATEPVLESISDAAGHQGVAGLAYKTVWKLENMLPADRPALLIVACGVQDPGNLGMIMRAADASGATGVIAAGGTVCPYNSKCVRATMGSIFRMPVVEAAEELHAIEELKEHKIAIVGTSLAGGLPHTEVNLRGPVAIVLGGEGGGLPALLLGVCDRTLRIPIRPAVESLNVAAAATVILYEAARQRKFEGLV